MAESFERHGFEPAYEVVVNPEFPANGVWPVPVQCFGRDGSRPETVPTRWGAPFIAAITPSASPSWVAMFEAGGLGSERGAHACPNAAQLCVLADGLAYLVDIEHQGAPATMLVDQVTQVVAVGAPALLLLVSCSEIAALGVDGVLWNTERIALDGLRVDRVQGSEIHCAADSLEGGWDALVLDGTTGAQVSGRRFGSIWPPDALA